jgi:hypothetical protein
MMRIWRLLEYRRKEGKMIGLVYKEEGIGFQGVQVLYLGHMMDWHGIGRSSPGTPATMEIAQDWRLLPV